MARYDQLALDRQLCFALYTASRAVMRAYGPLLERTGLTYPQYIALLALWEAPDHSLTVGELGERLRLDSGTVTPLLKRLEARGVVERRRDPADERRVVVTVTDEGLALRDEVASVPGELVRATGYGLDDVADLRARLVELLDHLDRRSA